MKIRIKGNSLRYRLTRSEVEKFKKEGFIEETVGFANQHLIYAIKQDEVKNLTASFADNKITLYMPLAMANEWTSTDIVGFEHNEGNFYLLVEKDFVCLDNVSEDQSDNYPNPLMGNC